MPERPTGSTARGGKDLSCRCFEDFSLLMFSDKIILNNALDLGKDGTDIVSALKYYDSINLYMKQLRGALGELRDDILAVASQELDEAEAGKSTGITILSFISVVTLIFYFFVKNALGVIRVDIQY